MVEKRPGYWVGALEYGKQPCRGASPARRMVCQRVGRPLSSARNQISRPLWRGPIPSFGSDWQSTRLNLSHYCAFRMPPSARKSPSPQPKSLSYILTPITNLNHKHQHIHYTTNNTTP